MSPGIGTAARLLAAVALAACLGACEGSGCGDSAQKENKPAASGGAASGVSSGGGSVEVGQKAENSLNAPLKEDAPKARTASGPQAPAAPPAGAVYQEIDSSGYEPKVIKSLGAVLVVTYTPKCKGWQDLQAALEMLSQDLAGRVAFYRLNVMDPAQAKVLPSGMTVLPVPGFAYYESGQALGQRQGLPFERKAGKRGEPIEDPAAYQARLRVWLKRALAEKNFNLPAPPVQ